MASERLGTLATQSQRHPGWPFASVMPYALDDGGAPLFLVSGMAIHTQNMTAEPRVSLLVMQRNADADPLGGARVTLMGTAAQVSAPSDDLRARYLERHPSAKYWIEFSDFSFFRLDVTDVYFVGGFGAMGWVTRDGYAGAQPDPLVDSAAQIIEHMNADHREALREITRKFGGVEAEEVTMVACDRLGFVVRAKTPAGMKGVRIQFPEAVSSRDDARRVLVEMTRGSR